MKKISLKLPTAKGIIPPLRAKLSQRSTPPLFEYTLLLIVIAQVAFLSYMNLFEAPKMIDYDGAKLYKHAIEMWENKSLFIPGWKYITTMELDCSLFLALPIYAVSHNIFTSFGIANIIMALFYIVIILSIFKRTRLQKGYALLSVSLVLMPYVSGMLEYFNMMFFNGSQYTVKVMVPLLFILLVTTEEDGRKKAGNIAAMVLYAFLLFLTSLSSGFYVMFCGILPLLLSALLDFMGDGGFKKYGRYHICLCAVSFAAFLCGTLTSKFLEIQARGNLMLLTKAENWEINLHAVFLGIFQVLESIPTGDVAAISVKGIVSLAKVFLTLLLLAACIFQMKSLFRLSARITPERFLSILFPWNLSILLFLDTRYSPSNLTIEYRYYLIAFIPLMLLLPMQLGQWMEHANRLWHRSISVFICLFLSLLCLGSFRNVWERREISLYVNDICTYINSLEPEADSVFFIPDEETPEMCRLLDSSRTYCGYNPENGGLVVYDYYQAYIDRASHGDKNFLLVYNWETPDMYLPSYISSRYEKVGSVRWYDIYYSPVNLFDSMSGFPCPGAEDSIDYFFSPGYVSNPSAAFINDEGELEVTGDGQETVNNTSFLPASGSYCIELSYEETSGLQAGTPIGILQICNPNGAVASAQLFAGQGSVLIDECTADDEVLSLHITISEGISCRLKSLHFMAADKQ